MTTQRDASYWRAMVKSYTAGLTDGEVESVVASLLKNPEQGVWHAAATFKQRPCYCAVCSPGVKRFA